MTESIVSLQNVSRSFRVSRERSLKERAIGFARRTPTETFWAVRDVSLEVPLGETVGLIGHNGSGKSTLLKIVGGILEPSAGRAMRRGRLAALLELGAGFHPDLTGRENVFLNAAVLGLTKAETERSLESIIDFSGIENFIDTQVKFYSSGMYVRLAFAVAVHADPDLLLVDEVLAVGDEPFQRKCMERIRTFQREGRSIVLVTHSAQQVAAICDSAVVLESGRMVYKGDPQAALAELRASFARHARPADVEEEDHPAVTIEYFEAFQDPKDSKTLVVRKRVQVHRDVKGIDGFVSVDTMSGVRMISGVSKEIVGKAKGGTEWHIEHRFEDLGLGNLTVMVNLGVGEAGEGMCHGISGATSIEWKANPTPDYALISGTRRSSAKAS